MITISDARQRLLGLFDRIAIHARQIVRVARIARTGRNARTPRSFSLIGSATLHVPADEVLRASRAQQRELAAAKRRSLVE